LTGIEIATLITAIVGAGTGIGALVLSLINTYVQVNNNRVKLKIVPQISYEEREGIWACSAIPFPNMMNAIKEKRHRLCIEVTNLSSFAVTINQVGFGKFKLHENGISIPFPKVMKRENCWPLKLDSRESDLLSMSSGIDIPIELLDKNCAFAVTQCGHIAYGNSDMFDAYVEELRKAKKA